MPKFNVIMTTEKVVQIIAEDLEEAMEKAERKINVRNDKWSAETGYEVSA